MVLTRVDTWRGLIQDSCRLLSPPCQPKPVASTAGSKPWCMGGCVCGQAQWITDQNIMEHPDIKAFQKVCLVLLLALDPVRATQSFWPIWPVVEKKHEAEFRKTLVSWYKELQLAHPGRLSPVNPSLFLTPGGAKCLQFLADVALFVTEEQVQALNKGSTVAFLTRPGKHMSANEHARLQQLYSWSIESNLKQAEQLNNSLHESRDKAKQFALDLTGKLKDLKYEKQAVLKLIQEQKSNFQGQPMEQMNLLQARCNALIGQMQADLNKMKAKLQLLETNDYSSNVSLNVTSESEITKAKVSSLFDRCIQAIEAFETVSKNQMTVFDHETSHQMFTASLKRLEAIKSKLVAEREETLHKLAHLTHQVKDDDVGQPSTTVVLNMNSFVIPRITLQRDISK